MTQENNAISVYDSLSPFFNLPNAWTCLTKKHHNYSIPDRHDIDIFKVMVQRSKT